MQIPGHNLLGTDPFLFLRPCVWKLETVTASGMSGAEEARVIRPQDHRGTRGILPVEYVRNVRGLINPQ